MKTDKHLALLMALALAAVPITALADDVAYDDDSFESATPLSLSVAPAVEFAAPGTGVYALDNVSFYLREALPGEAPVGSYPLAVQIWDSALDVVETIPWNVDFTGSAMYTLDLTAMRLPFTGSVRIGVFERDDALVPLPGSLSLGVDSVSTLPFGRSYVYDSTISPPLDPWSPAAASNLAIRASIHLVPAVTCQGFLPPLSRTRTMKRGGRTLPLKAFLYDGEGAPVPQGLLTAPPLVRLLYSSGEGAEPIDVTSSVAPAGLSGRGQAFRGTLEGKWIYNLKTKKNLPPGIYTVQMDSGDGTEYAVNPTCAGTFAITAPRPKKPHPAKGPKK